MTDFTVAHQQEDGRWNYSLDIQNGEERKQIDFHQGYVLDSIAYVIKYCGGNQTYQDAFDRGLKFYKEKQFYPSGRSLFRLPKEYPVEIHNQAQGIVTFSRSGDVDFAGVISDWTIKNMRSKKGYFYYKKYNFHTIKTPFIRWSQAWMLLALTELMIAQDG